MTKHASTRLVHKVDRVYGITQGRQAIKPDFTVYDDLNRSERRELARTTRQEQAQRRVADRRAKARRLGGTK